MAQSNQSDLIDNSFNDEQSQNKTNKGVVHLSKHQEEKQTSESSAFEQVMMQMNIADRKSFDKKYTQLWNEASEKNEMLSLMICEIDFFKAYHDNYGHQGASFMLLVIALALKTTCEEHDCYLGRYKGDEFGILLKGGDIDSVNEIAEKLRLAVEKSRTEHKFSSVSNIVTLSIGLSSFYPTSMQVVMNQASAALGSAKTNGRNQVIERLEHVIIPQPEAQQVASDVTPSQQTAPQQHQEAEQLMRADQLRKQEELRAKERREEELRAEELKAEELRAAEARQAEELKIRQAEELEAERERKEEELMRQQEEEDRKRREELSAYDMDPFF